MTTTQATAPPDCIERDTYTDPAFVTAYRATTTPLSGQTASGYGGKIPTRYMIRYADRWHRVYMMQYGNSGSAYILKGGQVHHLDTGTEHDLGPLEG